MNHANCRKFSFLQYLILKLTATYKGLRPFFFFFYMLTVHEGKKPKYLWCIYAQYIPVT